jgi:hypothetical protein
LVVEEEGTQQLALLEVLETQLSWKRRESFLSKSVEEKEREVSGLEETGLEGGETSASRTFIMDLPHRLMERLFLLGRLWLKRGSESSGISSWTFATSAKRPDKKAELTVERLVFGRSMLPERFRRLKRGSAVVGAVFAETGPS